MNDLQLIQKAVECRKDGIPAAIATIIKTKGSTPRNVASKMIIFLNGDILGTIGGGCGEAEVIEKALEVIEYQVPLVHHVDLTQGLFYEDGGICGGKFDVFIEPIL
ncbi:XdhC family protein [Bacillus timonensis]|nr:XdhC family protein [Bacillus timonensis]